MLGYSFQVEKNVSDLMTTKIGIIGCGWLGFPLAKSFLKKGYPVVGTTRTEAKKETLIRSGIEAYSWSISDIKTKQHTIFLSDIDFLILNIPPVKSGISNYSSAIASLVSTLNAKTKVIFISTTSVYPENIQEAREDYQWTENDLQLEIVQTELKLQEILGTKLTILRLAGLIGLDRHPVKYLSGKKELPSGKSPVNLIHLNDAIGLIEKIIEKKYWGEIVNGCFPEHPSKNTYYRMVANYRSIPSPEFRDELLTEKYVSSKKSVDKLGYNYQYSISSLEN